MKCAHVWQMDLVYKNGNSLTSHWLFPVERESLGDIWHFGNTCFLYKCARRAQDSTVQWICYPRSDTRREPSWIQNALDKSLCCFYCKYQPSVSSHTHTISSPQLEQVTFSKIHGFLKLSANLNRAIRRLSLNNYQPLKKHHSTILYH